MRRNRVEAQEIPIAQPDVVIPVEALQNQMPNPFNDGDEDNIVLAAENVQQFIVPDRQHQGIITRLLRRNMVQPEPVATPISNVFGFGPNAPQPIPMQTQEAYERIRPRLNILNHNINMHNDAINDINRDLPDIIRRRNEASVVGNQELFTQTHNQINEANRALHRWNRVKNARERERDELIRNNLV